MKTVSTIIFLAGLALASCTYHDLNPVYNLSAYHVNSMLYPSGVILPSEDAPSIVTIQYDDLRRPVKRTGGLIAAPSSLPFDYTFTDKMYEEISYDANRVSVVRKENFPDTDWPPTEKEIFFENGKISRIVDLRELAVGRIDTVDFFYDPSGLLKKTVGKRYFRSSTTGMYRLGYQTTREYFFAGGNLLKIEGVQNIAPGHNATTLELFEEYDRAPNPTRNLNIFDETFYRSLSKNNFRKYSSESRNIAGEVIARQKLSWTFEYDSDGVPLF